MNKVQIKPTETGAFISAYKNKPEFGFIKLQSEEISIQDSFVRNSVRTTLVKGPIELLEKFINTYGKTGNIPGSIVVREFTESQLPENFQSRLNKNVEYEDSIAPYVKRAGKDGVELTQGGERILRFTDYDSSGSHQDLMVAHDNISAIKDSRTVNIGSAALPA